MTRFHGTRGFFVLFVVTTLVALLTGCRFFTGSISGYAYAEGYTPETAAGFDIHAILVMDPAVAEQSIVVTDANGYFEIPDVPPGTYTLSPLYASDDWSVAVELAPGDQATVEVLTPALTLQFLDFNTRLTTPPFDDAVVRASMSAAIDREPLAATFEGAPALTFFSPDLELASFEADLALIPNNDLAAANSATTGVTPYSFDLLVNTQSTPIATAVEPSIEGLDMVTDVIVVELSFEDLLTRRADDDFQMSRMGWMLDSNNLARFLELWRTGGWTGYANGDYDAALDAAHTAIARGDLDAFESHIVDAHNMLVADMPTIPLYWR